MMQHIRFHRTAVGLCRRAKDTGLRAVYYAKSLTIARPTKIGSFRREHGQGTKIVSSLRIIEAGSDASLGPV